MASVPVRSPFRAGKPDGLQAVPAESAGQVDEAVARHRRRNRVHGQAGRVPHEFARLEIVAAHAVHAGRDDLGAAAAFDDERRGPGVDLVAFLAPELLAGALVERDDERLPLMVPHHDEAVAVQRGRAPLAELVAHPLVAKVLLPDRPAVHVEGVQPLGLERRDYVLAVGHRGTRRPRAVLGVRCLVRRLFACDALPEGPARAPIDREHDELVRHRLRAARGVRRVWRDTHRHGGQQEEAVTPDDRRRRSASGNLDLPLDVLRVAPFERRSGGRRSARRERTAPLGPELVGAGRRLCGEGSQEQRQGRGGKRQS